MHPTSSTVSRRPARPRARRPLRPRPILVIALAGLAVILGVQAAAAAPGDTTWVRTFDQELHSWADEHIATFDFPDTSVSYAKVVAFFTIGCPPAPGDCDPWDRVGSLYILRDPDRYEIARYVTPYDITPNPGTCGWQIDMSSYMHLLHGPVTLSSYIESWIGAPRGWLLTVDFALIEGVPDWEPYRITNLWSQSYAVYGDPSNPIEERFAPMQVPVDPAAERVEARVYCTGHGQGNTGNCAEFCSRWHQIVADGAIFQHTLWRSDCSQNACRPQGGTWTYPRAGWCPGDKAEAWVVDLTGAVTPGMEATLDYNVQPYTNYCCPPSCNPNCISGSTCSDCNYNYEGHTEPNYRMSAHLVCFRRNAASGVEPAGPAASRLELRASTPNPFAPPTTISYRVPAPGPVTIRVLDAAGRIVRETAEVPAIAGEHTWTWDGRDDAGAPAPAGVFFCEVSGPGGVAVRKLVLVK